MTLTTHAVAGAALTSAFGFNPVIGFAVGLASHFLLDAIPHWDYKLKSAKIDEKNPLDSDFLINQEAIRDLVKISFDCLLGFVLAWLFFDTNGQGNLLALLAGAVGGVLPDALQFVYLNFRREPLVSLQRFHIVIMHVSLRLTNPAYGVFYQGLILLLALFLGNWSFFSIW